MRLATAPLLPRRLSSTISFSRIADRVYQDGSSRKIVDIATQGVDRHLKSITRNVDAHVGARIRERRATMELTQSDLADALEVSYQQVQKYEAGTNRVSTGRLYEIARISRVTISYFFEGLEPAHCVPPLEHGGKNRTVNQLLQDFSSIQHPDEGAVISGLVKSIAGRRHATVR